MLSLDEFSKYIAENKGKRKFKQSVELAVNFKGVDFTKQENRLNLEVMLPNGKGKSRKIALFTSDKSLIESAKKEGIEVIEENGLQALASDQKRLASLLAYDMIAQPSLMPSIAKAVGQFLGPRNSMPKPLPPNTDLKRMAVSMANTATMRSKGKYLPTIHSVVGTEDMEPGMLYDNINAVVSGINRKLGQNHIRSAYVKLTMSKPARLI